MAAPDVSPEERDQLTEWVDVIAFSEAMQARLLACEKGETIAVSGNVTKKFYQRRKGETAEGRTIGTGRKCDARRLPAAVERAFLRFGVIATSSGPAEPPLAVVDTWRLLPAPPTPRSNEGRDANPGDPSTRVTGPT